MPIFIQDLNISAFRFVMLRSDLKNTFYAQSNKISLQYTYCILSPFKIHSTRKIVKTKPNVKAIKCAKSECDV